MSKKPASLQRLQDRLDEKAYEEISRGDPELAEIVVDMIKDGYSPDQIGVLIRRQSPQRWIESVQVTQAARYVQKTVRDQG